MPDETPYPQPIKDLIGAGYIQRIKIVVEDDAD